MFKKKLKNFLSLLVIFTMIVSSTATATAHSGRTDSNGGHYNKKTGEYHYHSGGSSSSSSPSYSTPKPTPKLTQKPIVNENYEINYNKKNINLYDKTIEKDRKVYAPLIQVLKELGYTVNYDLVSNIIYINSVGVDLVKTDKIYEYYEIYMDNKIFDTSKYKIEVIDKVLYVPILDYAEVLRCEITQDSTTKTIYIKWK